MANQSKEDRTIVDFLNRLPYPYSFQALANLKPAYANAPVPDCKEALLYAFNWSDSPEGWAYWMKVYQLFIFETWKLN